MKLSEQLLKAYLYIPVLEDQSLEGLDILGEWAQEASKLESKNEALKRARNGLLWLNNNIANYGSEDFLGYLKAAIQDALLTE